MLKPSRYEKNQFKPVSKFILALLITSLISNELLGQQQGLSSNRIVISGTTYNLVVASDWALHRLYRYIFSPSAIYNFNEYVA
jgi:hypothetical protein